MTTNDSLSRLSDAELLLEVKRLAAIEREATADLIRSLAEVEARRLHLASGCSSMFGYCTQVLHLSEHAAYARIAAARTATQFPVVMNLLIEGAITLTTVTLLGRHLTAENHAALLGSARHKSKADVEMLVATLHPQPDVPSSVRKVPAPTRQAAATPPLISEVAKAVAVPQATSLERPTTPPPPAAASGPRVRPERSRGAPPIPAHATSPRICDARSADATAIDAPSPGLKAVVPRRPGSSTITAFRSPMAGRRPSTISNCAALRTTRTKPSGGSAHCWCGRQAARGANLVWTKCLCVDSASMREPGRAIRSETRRVVVIVQVAITLTLLVASALAAQSLIRLAALDLGFDAANVLTLDLSRLDQSRYSTYAARRRVVDDLVAGLERLPGVQSAAAVLNRPFAHGVIGWDCAVLLEGQPDIDATWLKNPIVNFEAVTPGYFRRKSTMDGS